MDNLRILLLCKQSLLCDGLMLLLHQTANITLIGPWQVNDQVLARLAREKPDIILMVEPEDDRNYEITLTSQILEELVDLVVVRVGYTQNTLRLFTSHTLPATAAALVEAIHNTMFPGQQGGGAIEEPPVELAGP